VDDEIFFDSLAPPFGDNFNFEEVTHQGVETEARLTPWEWLELFGTHTFTRAIITDDDTLEGKTYPVTPRLVGTVGTTLRYEGAEFTLGGRYAGARYLINDVANDTEKLGSYWVVDLRLAYTWRHFTGYATVFNVLDEEYFDSAGLSFGTPRFNPAPERSYLVGGEVRF
jgi:outer membrane cobalamin receptor